MDDAAFVGGGQRVRDRDENRQQLRRRQRAVGELLTKRSTRDELGRDVEFAVDLFKRKDGRNGGVEQRRGRSRFSCQPLSSKRVARVVGREGLERNGSAQTLVLRCVNDPHAAAAALLDEIGRAHV